MIDIKIKKLSDNATIPEYATSGAAGADLYAAEDVVIVPMGIKLVKTDISVEIPEGYEIQIRPRSGLALKSGITVLNSPGTIDSDYRGNVGIILINHTMTPFNVRKGDRIAQMVLSKVYQAVFSEHETLTQTDRAAAGFGSTGKN